MWRVLHYYQQFQTARGRVTGLPVWARYVVFLFALPGIALIALSTLALVGSILALLLLTVPVYSLLRTLTGGRGGGGEVDPPDEIEPADSPGRRRVEARVIESE